MNKRYERAKNPAYFPGCVVDLDERFIRQHWHRISRAEAIRRHPGMTYRSEPGFYYTCDQFDEATNLCLAHDQRPPVCSGFPWYDNEPGSHGLRMLPRCSFWHDVPRAEWPEGVIPLTLVAP